MPYLSNYVFILSKYVGIFCVFIIVMSIAQSTLVYLVIYFCYTLKLHPFRPIYLPKTNS